VAVIPDNDVEVEHRGLLNRLIAEHLIHVGVQGVGGGVSIVNAASGQKERVSLVRLVLGHEVKEPLGSRGAGYGAGVNCHEGVLS